MIVLTTSSAEEDVFRSYDLGVSSYITKPVTFAGLVDAMNVLTDTGSRLLCCPTRRRHARKAPHVSDPDTGRLEVLLVDDDEEDYLLTLDLLSRLEGAEHELHWKSDYASGLKAALNENYDVCLVDYRLGAEDGIDLVRELVPVATTRR